MRGLLLPFVLLLAPNLASAQLGLRESRVVSGSYSVVGNQLIDCPGTAVCDNNTAVMVPVDIDALAIGDLDGDGADDTTMSSSANLELPLGATVRSATLYVSGYASEQTAAGLVAWTSTIPADYPVLFSAAGAPYVALIPEGVEQYEAGFGYVVRYPVTGLVTAPGEYTLANFPLPPPTHPYNRLVVWALFVTYEDGSPPRLVNLYDGSLYCYMNSNTISLTGFRTPATGAPVAQLTSWSDDGSAQYAGESITVGTQMVSNSENPANNIGNATVSTPAGPITRNPASFLVREEMDLDTFDVSSSFTNSQTSVDVTFTCGTLEGVGYHLAALSIGVIAPIIEVTKSVTDDNGGDAISGDELIYDLTVRNSGGDDAIGMVLTDPIPNGAVYVPGSIEYVGTTTSAQSDASNDDLAELADETLVFRLGAGATSTAGGALAVGEEAHVRFRAVIETATAAFTVENRATARAFGAQAGMGQPPVEVESNPPGGRGATVVDALPCEGFSSGACPDAGFPDTGAGDTGAGDTGASDAGDDTDASIKDGSPPSDSGASRDASSSVDAGETDESDGCACSTDRRAGRTSGWASLAVLGLLALRRSRRRT